MIHYSQTDYVGLLFIGDPHLEGRVPGFRRDDYPRVILEKLRWCLNYAKKERLLPAILGDFFNVPRDNPNWLIVELLKLFDQEVVGIYGNHDVHENEINEHDSLSILVRAGCIRMLSDEHLFRGIFNGRRVLVGGTCWGQHIPHDLDIWPDERELDPLTIWLTHHDLLVPGYEEMGKIDLIDRPEIDIVVNGHLHSRVETEVTGRTHWFTPGNISRRKRNEATREQVPSVLRIDIDQESWSEQYVVIPHRPFDEVFYEAITETNCEQDLSAFVSGLAELQARRTETGEGLNVFLDSNLAQFEEDVADEIRKLAQEVLE